MKKNLVRFGLLSAAFILGIPSSVWAQGYGDFVLVEGGTYQMGVDDDGTYLSYDAPVHEVTVDSFYICTHEVTNKEYEDVTGKKPSVFKGENRPVDSVSWYDAVEYCNQLSQKEGLVPCYKGSRKDGYTCDFGANGYRLPTEAEWEYAARGGKKTLNPTIYRESWVYSGNKDLGSSAWYEDNSNDKTHEVMKKAPNELGLYDMCGNVCEWCWDLFARYSPLSQTNPTGESNSDGWRVQRGGEFDSETHHGICSVTYRSSAEPDDDSLGYGFRVVRTANAKNDQPESSKSTGKPKKTTRQSKTRTRK